MANAFVPLHSRNKSRLARLRNRAFNKLVLGEKFGRLTDEERRAYFNDGEATLTGQIEGDPAKGGYIVPEEQMNILREYRKAYVSLKSYCHVVQVHSNTGKFPTLGEETGTLLNFSEMNQIKESDFEFGQNGYTIKDYGDIIPVSNTLIQDADINILNLVGQRFARKSINTENAEILKLLKGMTATAITGYKNLTKALNVDLDPVYYANAKIFTNQDGFQWLSELEDAQNRPLILPDVAAPDTYKFRGKEIVVLPNGQLSMSKAIPFFIGNLADYCMFFDRMGVEIATSIEYMFGKNATALRCIERFDVAVDDTDAMKAYKVTVS